MNQNENENVYCLAARLMRFMALPNEQTKKKKNIIMLIRIKYFEMKFRRKKNIT